jgi:hypothetical protein
MDVLHEMEVRCEKKSAFESLEFIEIGGDASRIDASRTALGWDFRYSVGFFGFTMYVLNYIPELFGLFSRL